MKSLLQTESSECGLACLAMLASHYGYHTDLADLRRQFSISLKGATLAQLMRHAAAMQLSTRPLRLELDEISELALPCILHWNLNHFVVLKKISKNWQGKVTLVLLDPAVGERRVSLDEASQHFTGVALEVIPSASFKPKDERKKIVIRDLTGHIVGLRRALVQVLLLALALEIFAIASPLFNQFVIDEVIVSGDRELLTVLVFGFGLLMVTQTAIGLARSWFLMRWSMDIGYQWSGRVFAHLIRLPVSFFEKRHLGDVVSRFGSIGAIQGTLTSLFVESALDGLMALLALGMMLMYSVKLSMLVLVGVILYSGFALDLVPTVSRSLARTLSFVCKRKQPLLRNIARDYTFEALRARRRAPCALAKPEDGCTKPRHQDAENVDPVQGQQYCDLWRAEAWRCFTSVLAWSCKMLCRSAC